MPRQAGEYSVAARKGRRTFRVSPWLTVLTAVACALFVSLGRWQLDRAEQKRVLFEGFASGAGSVQALPLSFEPVARYQRVSVSGRYDGARQFLLDNMSHDGQPGFQVLTPLVLDDGRVVIVNRGFVAFGTASRNERPPIEVGGGQRRVAGRADSLPRPAVELEAAASAGWPRVVSFPRSADLAAALGATVHPQVLLLDAGEPEGFLRAWTAPGLPPDRHIGYAVQWFGFAAAVAVIWLVLGFRREEVQ